jgi:uncharacterized protein (TIGR01777 family)
MQILITGGSGLIGKEYSRELIAAGHSVWVLTRNTAKMVTSDGAKMVLWDGETPKGWGNLVEQVDAIVNLTGEGIGSGLWTKARKERILSSRVNAGNAVMLAIKEARHRPAVLIQASAIGYYGPGGDRMIDETSPAGDDYLSQICTNWEASVAGVKDLGVRIVGCARGLCSRPGEGCCHCCFYHIVCLWEARLVGGNNGIPGSI